MLGEAATENVKPPEPTVTAVKPFSWIAVGAAEAEVSLAMTLITKDPALV